MLPYRLGAAIPGVVLGLLPSLVGIVTGNAPIMLFGLFFTFAAGGDALVLWLIRKVDPNALSSKTTRRMRDATCWRDRSRLGHKPLLRETDHPSPSVPLCVPDFTARFVTSSIGSRTSTRFQLPGLG